MSPNDNTNLSNFSIYRCTIHYLNNISEKFNHGQFIHCTFWVVFFAVYFTKRRAYAITGLWLTPRTLCRLRIGVRECRSQCFYNGASPMYAVPFSHVICLESAPANLLLLSYAGQAYQPDIGHKTSRVNAASHALHRRSCRRRSCSSIPWCLSDSGVAVLARHDACPTAA